MGTKLTIEEAYLKEYGLPPDDEITAEVWAWVHAQYTCPTSIRAFYTFAALVESRHRLALAAAEGRVALLEEERDTRSEAWSVFLTENAGTISDLNDQVRSLSTALEEARARLAKGGQ